MRDFSAKDFSKEGFSERDLSKKGLAAALLVSGLLAAVPARAGEIAVIVKTVNSTFWQTSGRAPRPP